jgi:hypothetical protein
VYKTKIEFKPNSGESKLAAQCSKELGIEQRETSFVRMCEAIEEDKFSLVNIEFLLVYIIIGVESILLMLYQKYKLRQKVNKSIKRLNSKWMKILHTISSMEFL